MTRHIQTHDVGEVTIVRILDHSFSRCHEERLGDIKQAVLAMVSNGRKVIFDLSDVEIMGSAALGILITIKKKTGGPLVIFGASEHALEVFSITRVDRLFTIVGDEATAIDAVMVEEPTYMEVVK
jgi:anti-anti-sigma factor